MCIRDRIGAKIEKEGEFTVPAKLLAEYINAIPDEKINFEFSDNALHVKGTKYKAQINGIEADEFPDIPETKGAENVILSAHTLHDQIGLVAFAASADESRPAMTGVYLEIEGKKLSLVAADGYRLAESVTMLDQDSGKNNIKLLIPAKSLIELQKILSETAEKDVVSVAFDKNQIVFSFEQATLVSRLLAGQFPDYKQILPGQSATQASLDKEQFTKAIRTATLFAKDSAGVIHINLLAKEQKMEIEASASQIGENQIEMESKIEGEGGGISFNARYLIDVLSVLDQKETVLKINDELSPGEISLESKKEGESFRYIVMPIRT